MMSLAPANIALRQPAVQADKGPLNFERARQNMKDNREGIPPSAALMQMITGFWVSSAIYVAAKLELADHTGDKTISAQELAQSVGAHPGSLYRLLSALASIGVFTEVEPRRFALTAIGKCLKSGPGSLRAFSIVGRELGWEPWGHLLHSVRTGETAFGHLHEMGYFEYLKQNPELARLFDEAMMGFVTMNGLAVVAAYDFTPFSTIIDIGGGRATLMAAMLKQNSQAKGIVFDRPEVAEEANKSLVSAGISNRCRYIGGDFFVSVPSGGDVYILASVLHDWDDEKSLIILKNCRRTMGGAEKLLLVEMILPPGNAPFFGKLLDLNMLVNFGGRERTEVEYRKLLSTAGFKLTRIIQTKTPSSLIEAIPD